MVNYYQVCRAIGSLAELRENKLDLDKNNVCKIVINALQKHVSGDSLFSSVFQFQSNHSAAVAQWGLFVCFISMLMSHTLGWYHV